MTAIYETAYPRIKNKISKKELNDIYTPSAIEIKFIFQQKRQPNTRFALLLLLKTFQRLGYFIKLNDVPISIKKHIVNSVPNCTLNNKTLDKYDSSGARQRFINTLRGYLKVKPFDDNAFSLLEKTTQEAANTKEQIPDIVNVAIEELIRQRFELPGFTTLVRTAKSNRTMVNERYYDCINNDLNEIVRKKIDILFRKSSSETYTGWNKLKREPKKPTNKEIKSFLIHIEWLQKWTLQLPNIESIPVAKRRQFMLEARALDASELKRLKPNKRYTLIVILIYSQLYISTDSVVTIFIRKINNLHNKAEERLKKHQLEQTKIIEKLISQFRDVLHAYQDGNNDRQKIKGITKSFKTEPEQLLTDCEEHLAFAGNNYYPFMLVPYRQLRPLLLNCLELVNIESSTKDDSIINAIKFILHNRKNRKETIELDFENSKVKLHWIPDKWRKLVTGHSIVKNDITSVNRKYFELCLFTQIARELKSADLIVTESEEYKDFNSQLISWDEYDEQIDSYCEMLGFSNSINDFVSNLKMQLSNTASDLDNSYPENHSLTISENGLTIHRSDKKNKPKNLFKVDELITKQLKTKSILDILVESEGWLNLHKKFGPISGFEGKIKDKRKRFITTLFCYGCNLGPSQTALSIKGLSRKQVAWLNLHHVTEERLDKAIVDVINVYNKFRLPNYWGSGKHASVDGTKWDLYEQNLLSEYHIRYGGYGGIGYYHVSDTYIALFSHFIPCGVYEAIYILDGLIKNKSDIQPDVIHGDTHAQSTSVFGLSHLLGIELMPRIRNIKDLLFFKPDNNITYEHINSLFKEKINWRLIETHMPDMLRVALSIKSGQIAPSAILRRLGSYSRKNKLYFAFRELGRVVRTNYLLKYIGDVELRQTVNAATNKSEEFNNFVKWLFFGGNGIISENIRYEQRKVVKYGQLVSNMVILYNVEVMTRELKKIKSSGLELDEEILAGLSPYRTSHINRFGDYTLDLKASIKTPKYSSNIL